MALVRRVKLGACRSRLILGAHTGAEVLADSCAGHRSRPMRPTTVVREGVLVSRSPVSWRTIHSCRAWARAPRTLNPTGQAGWRART